MASDKVLTELKQPIADVFNNVISGVQKSVDENNHQAAVDIELQFMQATISSKGIPLFTKRKDEATMQIKLATRIIPRS